MKWVIASEWVGLYPKVDFRQLTRPKDSTETTPDYVILQTHLDRARSELTLAGADKALECFAPAVRGAQMDLARFYLESSCNLISERDPVYMNYVEAKKFCTQMAECNDQIVDGDNAPPSDWVIGGGCDRQFTAETLNRYAPTRRFLGLS